MSSPSHQTLRGMRDLLPEETPLWRRVEEAARATCAAFGYREIRVPVLEETELFERSMGEATDVVAKEMYTFEDRGERSVSLRPEGTAGVVRAAIQHGMLGHRKELLRLWYMGPMFRYEKPQKGRYREFFQMGVEVLGSEEAAVDAETLELAWTYLDRLGFENLTLLINSIGCHECRPHFRVALVEFFVPRQEELCDDCRERLHRNPLRLLDCKEEGCLGHSGEGPVPGDTLCGSCRDHFAEVRGLLEALGLSYRVEERLVRGLDYYVRTVFEVVDDDLGAQNTLLGGGRYDGLVRDLGGPPTPGMGFAAGLDRLVLLLQERAPLREAPDLYLVHLGGRTRREAMVMAHHLRAAGIDVEVDLLGGGAKGQFKRADRSGAPRVVVLGEDEMARGVVNLKDMESGEQEELPRDGLAEKLASAGAGPTAPPEGTSA